MTKPKVYLVGAGPGDAGLITVKGAEVLKKADIVLYDYLVNPELLDYCPKDCKKIYVGKRDKQHTYPQDKMNKMLIELSSQYNTIVRLKGGDPFVFGRGAEEVTELILNDIDYEIVPGITSGIAAPAYMGIPVTSRNTASSVAFTTGHSCNRSSTKVNFSTLGGAVGTLVIYMGLSNISSIVDELLEGGKEPNTPIAIIRRGTYPEQEMIKGTLQNIISLIEKSKFEPPALIIVGEVVNYSDRLHSLY